MTKPIALTHDNRVALDNAINSHEYTMDAKVGLHKRIYTMYNPNTNDCFCIHADNNGHRIIRHNCVDIADSDTLKGNMTACMDIDNFVSQTVQAYIEYLTRRVKSRCA